MEPSPEPTSESKPAFRNGSRRQQRRTILWVGARAGATAVVLVFLYYTLPFDRDMTSTWIAVLVIGLIVVAAIIGWEVREILHSPHPLIRAVEALAFAIPLFLLLFATTYFLMQHTDQGAFNSSLTRTDSLYFTITVFATVGFGDIVPKTELARLVVSLQMITDLILIGLVVHAIVGAARMGLQRRYGMDPPLG